MFCGGGVYPLPCAVRSAPSSPQAVHTGYFGAVLMSHELVANFGFIAVLRLHINTRRMLA